MNTVKVGVIGCGHISRIYLENLTNLFEIVEVVACADLYEDAAKRRAEEFNIPTYCSVEEILLIPEIDILVNLTVPQAHAEVSLKILEAGKHLYSEKPLALNREDAEAILALAKVKNRLVGCAPDVFLGAGIQTVKKILADGWIGEPYAAFGQIVMGNGYDAMHPSFPSLLKPGWDPLFDMAPYYLSAFINFFGSINRVAGMAGNVQERFTVTNPKSAFFNQTLPIEAPMHASAVLEFDSGVVANLQASKASFGYLPKLEIYGTEGILQAPDPNFFSGPILIQKENQEIKEFPFTHSYREDTRGIGIADMAYALRSGREHRANDQLAHHLLEATFGIMESSESGQYVSLQTKVKRPQPMPLDLKYNVLDN
ncbi:Gfo/Idh/MocA family protein [Gracilibacillus alcaliphilus]|uniref:Gfo/Idh/MocA family protein n=1 Tax=Gracilibacillus alcaliphilus TaxID=1401441 RepID=UPI00195A14B4|nr:Gfo/Idh/MocA family oxidoreductase [Gracilibacillus alcaliphilus]MBM7675636.1 putative dehydrogenase [Gracilibacillus alcaliphilus]